MVCDGLRRIEIRGAAAATGADFHEQPFKPPFDIC
jgi:hypothetical protein